MSRPFEAGLSPDLVIAVGTAGTCTATPNWNGWVTVGTSVFMHDGHPSADANPFSEWRGPFDQLLESYIDPSLFAALAALDVAAVSSHFLSGTAQSKHFFGNFDRAMVMLPLERST